MKVFWEMKNEVLLTQYDIRLRRIIYLLRKHDIISVPIIREAYIIRFRRERISLKKSACKASGFFLVGEDGFVCIFIPLWGMKIEVLTPSSRRQATVPRTVAFWIFESALQPSKRTKRPIQKGLVFLWWGRTDSNHRSETQQIYSLSPLATRELPQICGCFSKTRLL